MAAVGRHPAPQQRLQLSHGPPAHVGFTATGDRTDMRHVRERRQRTSAEVEAIELDLSPRRGWRPVRETIVCSVVDFPTAARRPSRHCPLRRPRRDSTVHSVVRTGGPPRRSARADSRVPPRLSACASSGDRLQRGQPHAVRRRAPPGESAQHRFQQGALRRGGVHSGVSRSAGRTPSRVNPWAPDSVARPGTAA